MQAEQIELSQYLPIGWQLKPVGCGIRLIAPSETDAGLFFEGAKKYLKQSADHLKATIELFWEGCAEPLRVEGAPQVSQSQPNSYGATRLSANASYEAVMDFIRGQEAGGMICTVMSQGTDQFLFVNGAQVADRGGSALTWVGVDAKQLVWGRSLMGTLPGRDRGINYYARLHELLERDRFIDRYEYCVTRPNGDLHRDVSTYHYVESYLGVPARVAVSRVGDSELVEAVQR